MMNSKENPFFQDICPFCKGHSFIVIHRLPDQLLEGDRLFSLLKCTACEGVFLQGSCFTSEEDYFNVAYSQLYYQGGMLASPGQGRIPKHHLIDTLIRHRSPLSCLDIGCGNGEFLRFMQSKGHHISGCELNSETARLVSEKLGCSVYAGPLESMPHDKKFDLLTMWDVLEHFLNPRKSLELLSDHLAKEGRIIFGVPNFASFEAKLLGASWFGLEVPRHISQCTPKHIHLLLTSAGLELVSLRTIKSSYFRKSFSDSRLFEKRNRFSISSLDRMQWLLSLFGNRAYLLGVAKRRPMS
ncbi:MAG: class I SAM-dependent methyltransferase [Magnetococcus sp. DMHC-6]